MIPPTAQKGRRSHPKTARKALAVPDYVRHAKRSSMRVALSGVSFTVRSQGSDAPAGDAAARLHAALRDAARGARPHLTYSSRAGIPSSSSGNGRATIPPWRSYRSRGRRASSSNRSGRSWTGPFRGRSERAPVAETRELRCGGKTDRGPAVRRRDSGAARRHGESARGRPETWPLMGKSFDSLTDAQWDTAVQKIRPSRAGWGRPAGPE